MNTITLSDLSQFTGTEEIHRNFLGFPYTDGIQYLAEQAKAYWLIDAIASYQYQLKRDEYLAYFQVWVLSVVGEGERKFPFILPEENYKAVITCWSDTPKEGIKPAVIQQIEYTKFPLIEIKLYVSGGVLMLPSEY
ncbi:MAG: DUF6876 family protein [Planktothrix sp.]|uniref:DUF6876 family protein n=1 Tax=Planktothrix sp. TaxID=3088171 RepID=UPI0038D50772